MLACNVKANVEPGGGARYSKAVKTRVQACVAQALAQTPELRGDFAVEVELHAHGLLVVPRVTDNSVPDCRVVRCARDAFRAEEFALEPGVERVTLEQRFFVPPN